MSNKFYRKNPEFKFGVIQVKKIETKKKKKKNLFVKKLSKIYVIIFKNVCL